MYAAQYVQADMSHDQHCYLERLIFMSLKIWFKGVIFTSDLFLLLQNILNIDLIKITSNNIGHIEVQDHAL